MLGIWNNINKWNALIRSFNTSVIDELLLITNVILTCFFFNEVYYNDEVLHLLGEDLQLSIYKEVMK